MSFLLRLFGLYFEWTMHLLGCFDGIRIRSCPDALSNTVEVTSALKPQIFFRLEKPPISWVANSGLKDI